MKWSPQSYLHLMDLQVFDEWKIYSCLELDHPSRFLLFNLNSESSCRFLRQILCLHRFDRYPIPFTVRRLCLLPHRL